MDVICISSDSEDVPPVDQSNIYSQPVNLEDDVFICDWDEDYAAFNCDARPEPEPGTSCGGASLESNQFVSPPNGKEKYDFNTNAGGNSNEKLTTSVYDINEDSSPEHELEKNAFASLPIKKNNEQMLSNGKSLMQKTNRKKLSQEEKETVKLSKEQQKQEKQRLKEERKTEQQRQKAFKAAFAENKRNIRPEENIKFLRVHVDNEIINSGPGANIISLLQQNDIQFSVEPQIMSHIITWSKKKTVKDLDEYGEIVDIVESTDEKELLYFMDWKKAVQFVNSGDLLSHVETVKSIYSNKNITIIIYGLEKYFNYWKSKNKNDSKTKAVKLTQVEREFDSAPHITRDQLEFALTDLQIMGKHNSRLIEIPEELSMLVLNFTKSLSQLEYKLDQQRRQEDDFDWFAKGDSNQTVKVEKNGVGLIKVWQQQICQFPAAGVEMAQAIISHYNSPLSLVTKYEECSKASTAEGELLLQNIQIRREWGLLSSTRRIGPQLSRKMHKFFTSDDPDVEL